MSKDWWLGKTPEQQEAKQRRNDKFHERIAEIDAKKEKRLASPRLSAHRFDAVFEDYRIAGDKLKKGFKSWPIAGAKADFEHGADNGSRVTATRVLLTGVFALGLKKSKNMVYVMVELADGEQLLIESKAKNEKAGRLFASKVNQAGAHYAQAAEAEE